jgi:inorganic triphosphatase YgiF
LFVHGRERRAKTFAAEVLRRRSKKLLKKARRIEELDATQRHKLRIASKKLRYATEFFAALFSRKKRKGRPPVYRSSGSEELGAAGSLVNPEVRAAALKDK